ncbi:shikimate kinase [Litorihabitans aurantiacus]|uniref:Shikimate kinase n=1 Tax=Litorihabitans aurantiacus TaxID=1930061 RepID=A0AA37UVM4_9MICO|nr:shikimate kinase [Litorihabitans aurantiacus]GMA31266.1 shikimate kinase [Litorihabitans aurantiacus]
MSARPAVVLCGPMGSGKSAVGRRLATRLATGFLDSDTEVEETEGRTVAEIFASDGEPRFRDLEHAAVARALTGHDGVLALGGGAVMDARTQEALADYRAAGGVVAYLQVGVRDAMLRIGSAASRPLLAEDPRERWSRLASEREGTYRLVSDLVVVTDRRSPGAVVREIADHLSGAEEWRATTR